MTEAPSERTRVKRLNKRAKYDKETVHGILDAMPICSVGYVFKGTPYVTPTLQWREDDHIYWHGSSASRMLETCVDADVCVTVTMIDGMVMARAAFHHSCNYRSVMVMGKAHIIRDPAEKEQPPEKLHRETVSRALGYAAAGHGTGIEGHNDAWPVAGRSLRQGAHRPAR